MTRLGEELDELVTAAVRAEIARLAPRVLYGVVVGAPDVAARSVAVALRGRPEASPGFVYGEHAPAEGDLVRVVILTTGDRYVDAVLGRDVNPAWLRSPFVEVVEEADRVRLQLLGQGAEAPGIELRALGGGTPFIDFSRDDAADFDVRLMLSAADVLNVQGGGLRVSDVPVLLDAAGAIDTANLATAAKRLRYVPVTPSFIINGSTTTADVASTLVELTNIPANVAALVAVVGMVRTSDTSGANMTLRGFDDTEATIGYSTGVASRGGTFYGLCVPGGTNGREIRYTIDWTSGTVTYYVRPVGYFTLDD